MRFCCSQEKKGNQISTMTRHFFPPPTPNRKRRRRTARRAMLLFCSLLLLCVSVLNVLFRPAVIEHVIIMHNIQRKTFLYATNFIMFSPFYYYTERKETSLFFFLFILKKLKRSASVSFHCLTPHSTSKTLLDVSPSRFPLFIIP